MAVTVGVSASPALLFPFIGWGAYLGVVGGSTIIASGGAAIITYIMRTGEANAAASYTLP